MSWIGPKMLQKSPPTTPRSELVLKYSIDVGVGVIDADRKLCKRNQEIWQKQIIPHTSGAKSIARRRAELEKIEVHSSQQPMELTVNSPLDALGVVFGKEHPGRV
ncbi:hypothetical protein Ahy_B03g065097 [Arachis hypogaea]|uniref:Uncharacterized protein n=1 Tax=Arachis hypogaea TaxID=3818 RepID=A0A445A0V9_ARAHY|nr:hypothetical protein Ahy_B03g065097 [Arachis hypogaea]